ncbi:MAG: hypothetical protein NC222_06630 [Staphylococcus sp.]|nr:hypothetical protein [Staphylococcus sp.]
MKSAITKEEIINDFKNILSNYKNKFGNNNITRDFYVENSPLKYKYKSHFSFGELKSIFGIRSNAKCDVYTKEEIVNDYKQSLKKYFNIYGFKNMSRDMYNKFTKIGQKAYKKFFNSYQDLVKENREDDEYVELDKSKKRYVISSIIAGSKNNEQFLNALLRYCMYNNAQLLLIPLKGLFKNSSFNPETMQNWSKYFIKEADFNSNLKLNSLFCSANTNNPLYRVKEIAHKGYSLIVGHYKQRMEVIPTLKTGKIHIAYTTGTVSELEHKDNLSSFLNSETKKIGALVVEIENDKLFHIRNIEWINDNFVDLNKRYYYDRVENANAEAIVAGDLHISGDEDNVALNALKEQIKLVKANKMFIHDLASHNSINHHENENLILSSKNIISLEKEHQYISNWFNEWSKDIKNVKFYVVASNHNDWLYQYLSNRKTWIYDKINTMYANKLCGVALEGKDPFEFAIKKNLNKKIKIEFLKRTDSVKIAGYELSMHGDKCGVSKFTSLKQLKNGVGKLICGHSHSPKILDDSFQVGTNTKIPLPYAYGTVNNWIHANCTVYETGQVQMLMSFNGKWKLD